MADKIDINEKKAKIEWIYNSGDNYNYNRITKRDTKKYRLPFALCKSRGITIQDWWRPRDAWNALKRKGVVDNVSEEYKEFYRQKESANSKESRKRNKAENIKIEKQLKDPNHNPDRNYKHKDGYIAGAIKGKPMNFKQADSGNVNPYYYSKHLGYDTNCQTCVVAYEARRRGYNVRALPNFGNKYIQELSKDTSLAYIKKDGTKPTYLNKPENKGLLEFLEEEVEKKRSLCFEV